MTKQQKSKFVCSHMQAIQQTVLSKISQMPEEWDENELSQYIADKCIDASPFAHQPELRLDVKNYRNEILVCHL
jgi:hypothetical protein